MATDRLQLGYGRCRQHQQGLALYVVIIVLVVGISIMIGLMKLSGRIQQSSVQNLARTKAEIQLEGEADRIRLEVLSVIQEALANPSAYNIQCPSISTNGLDGQCMKTILAARRSAQTSATLLYVRCLGQGVSLEPTCLRDQVFPKIYDFALQLFDPATGTLIASQTEFSIQRASLSAYAFFVKGETKDFITIGPNTIKGLYGLRFQNPELTLPSPQKRLRFRPGSGSITFENLFVTNLPLSQFDIENQAAVQFESGVLNESTGVGFGQLNALHGFLKSQAVNEPSLPSRIPGCSRVLLNEDPSEVDYLEYDDPNCASATPSYTNVFQVLDNESIYARGSRVFLQASSMSQRYVSNNIAIIADGDVHLRTSMIRKEDAPTLSSYPTVLTPGNLVVPRQMRTLLSSPTSLEELTSTPNIPNGGPTIQADLSFISISPGLNDVGQPLPGGSVLFDETLYDAPSAAQAVSLGKAVLNGLFVSEVLPVTRKLFTNPLKTDGFSEVIWAFPSALSAIPTDWFSSHLEGGALQAKVLRYERQIIDQNKALQSYPPAFPNDSQ